MSTLTVCRGCAILINKLKFLRLYEDKVDRLNQRKTIHGFLHIVNRYSSFPEVPGIKSNLRFGKELPGNFKTQALG